MESDPDAFNLHPKVAIPEDLVLINALRLSRRLGALSCLLLLAISRTAAGQTCTTQGSSTAPLPNFSGTINGDAISTGSGNDYVYVLTQWGFARGSLTTDPGNPANISQVIIAREPGSGSTGLIPISCDCHQGGTVFDVAEAPDGSARLVSDYTPRDRLTLNGELVRADGAGLLRFGQQIAAGTITSKPTAIYLPSSGKYIGYFATGPTTQIFDLTNTTGSTSTSSGLQPIATFPWVAPTALRAAHLTGSSFDKFLLAGFVGGSIRVAVLDPVSGTPAEIGAIPSSVPTTLFWGVVNDRVFLVGAFPNDAAPSLKLFEYQVGSGALSFAYQIPGKFTKGVLRGNASLQFPALLAHRVVSGSEGYIDIYDTKFLTQGGAPQLAVSLRHEGATAVFQSAFDAVVRSNGSAVLAYLYRLVYVPPSDGGSTLLPTIHTDNVDISCIEANPTAPPTAGATAVNKSAQLRLGAEATKNYFGDQWDIKDASSSFTALTNVKVKYVYTGTFDPPTDVNTIPPAPPAHWDSLPIYWPCDPANGGNVVQGPSLGTGCYASLGGSQGPFKFVLKVTNPFGSDQFSPIAIPVLTPQIQIAALSGGTLLVLGGGEADARGTQGNAGDATFTWAFSGLGGPIPGPYTCGQETLNCRTVVVPATATGFSLAVQYHDGYAPQPMNGAVNVVDLVPAFTVSPNPVLLNSALTLTNRMQIGAGTTLNSVAYSIKNAAAAVVASGTLAASFFPFLGTAQITAPGTVGSYTADLTYTFSGPHGGQSLPAPTQSFSATDFAPNPSPDVTLDSAGLQGACPFGAPCALRTNTTYYLFDREAIPQGVPHPDSQWSYLTSSGSSFIGTATASAGPVAWSSPGTTCNSNCRLQVTVGGVSQTFAITLSNPAPPPPPPPPTLSVSLSGPTSAATGQSVSFTATVFGASGSVTYSWAFGDSPLGGQQAGGATKSHVYTAPGAYTVLVQVQNGAASASATAPISIAQGGPPAPSGDLTLSPSQKTGTSYAVGRGQEITFTASEVNAAQWGWSFGDGTAAGGAGARVVKKTYADFGTYNAQLLVYGDTTHTAGLTVTNFTVVAGAPLPLSTFSVAGATQNPATGDWNAEVGTALVFTALEPNASSFGWTFGDGTSGSGRVVTKSYASSGSVTVRLTVTGDGVNNSGTSSGTAVVNISPSTFHAAIVPGAAHLDDGTTTWGTDVSIANGGISPMTVSMAFLPLLPDGVAPDSLNLSALTYAPNPITLDPGGSWSASDIVTYLNGGNNKGTLVFKYTGATQPPLVSTRVYFAPKVNPGNISYGSALPAYQVDGSGSITPQGFISTALSGQQAAGTLSTEAVAGVVTVNKTGSGSGTVRSDPVGIDCGATCSASFPAGTSVFLVGSAAPGSVFFGITGCTSYPVGQCVVDASASPTVTAEFRLVGGGGGGGGGSNVTLSVSKGGAGSGTVSSSPAGIDCGAACSASFATGTSVTLTAAPISGSTFSGWSGACSGTGTSCFLTLSANQSVTASFAPASTPPQGDQVLIGLRSDPRSRFVVTLFNAAGSSGDFELKATDDQGVGVLVLDSAGNRAASRKFPGLRPYQQVYLRDGDLGLDDGKHYVLRATRTSSTGTLLAFGTALDRQTNDFLEITDDSQASPAESEIVSYWVAGVSRYDSSYGAHWRTDLRIFNRASHPRNLYFEYTYTLNGVEHVAHVDKTGIAAGELKTYDDVIGSLLSQDTSVDLSGNTAGVLRIYYQEDSESATHPLIIGSRNYDDQPTGTAGSQLAVYTRAQAAGPGQKLLLTGAEDSDRYSSKIGVFLVDPGPVSFRVVVVAPDGSQVGGLSTTLGGSGLHFGQVDLTFPGLNFQNPGKPVSIRIDQISGGRVSAYAFTVDKVTLDTSFIQGLPK